jgi:hypothetical protein
MMAKFMFAFLAITQVLASAQRPSEPIIAKGFVGNPAFETKEGPVDAGTAFLMRTDRPFEVVLLTEKEKGSGQNS